MTIGHRTKAFFKNHQMRTSERMRNPDYKLAHYVFSEIVNTRPYMDASHWSDTFKDYEQKMYELSDLELILLLDIPGELL